MTNIINTITNWKPTNLSDMDWLLLGCALAVAVAGVVFAKILLSR